MTEQHRNEKWIVKSLNGLLTTLAIKLWWYQSELTDSRMLLPFSFEISFHFIFHPCECHTSNRFCSRSMQLAANTQIWIRSSKLCVSWSFFGSRWILIFPKINLSLCHRLHAACQRRYYFRQRQFDKNLNVNFFFAASRAKRRFLCRGTESTAFTCKNTTNTVNFLHSLFFNKIHSLLKKKKKSLHLICCSLSTSFKRKRIAQEGAQVVRGANCEKALIVLQYLFTFAARMAFASICIES